MNWARGLLRLWLVLSVLWIAMWTAVMRPDSAWAEYHTAVQEARSAAQSAKDRMESTDEREIALRSASLRKMRAHHEKSLRAKNDLLSFGFVAFGFSAACLAIGAALFWAVRGFRSDKR